LNPSNHFLGESCIAGCFAIFFAGQVAEKLEKIAGVVDHGIICSNQSYAVIASKGEVQVIEEKSPVIP